MLGIWYDAERDVFGFKFEQVKNVTTRRQLVSSISSIFDPFGMMVPIVVVGNSLIQQAWMAKTGWDEGLPEEVLTRWRKWNDSFALLGDLQVPRCVQFTVATETIICEQLHIFCDASEIAFGAIAYLRI